MFIYSNLLNKYLDKKKEEIILVNLFDRFVDFQNARFAILMISLEARMITIENKKKREGKKRETKHFARKESPSNRLLSYDTYYS